MPVPPSPAHPLQNLNEIQSLWDYVAARPHSRVLEIGSLYGGTLWYWSHLPSIEVLVSIDQVTDQEPARTVAIEARSHWVEWFGPTCELAMIEADSTSLEAQQLARRWAPYDYVFIDGDHSYEGIRWDWLNYSPTVRPGGIVAFHDTWPNHDRHEPGVVQWCDELRHSLPSVQWTDPDGVGICAFMLPG